MGPGAVNWKGDGLALFYSDSAVVVEAGLGLVDLPHSLDVCFRTVDLSTQLLNDAQISKADLSSFVGLELLPLDFVHSLHDVRHVHIAVRNAFSVGSQQIESVGRIAVSLQVEIEEISISFSQIDEDFFIVVEGQLLLVLEENAGFDGDVNLLTVGLERELDAFFAGGVPLGEVEGEERLDVLVVGHCHLHSGVFEQFETH